MRDRSKAPLTDVSADEFHARIRNREVNSKAAEIQEGDTVMIAGGEQTTVAKIEAYHNKALPSAHGKKSLSLKKTWVIDPKDPNKKRLFEVNYKSLVFVSRPTASG